MTLKAVLTKILDQLPYIKKLRKEVNIYKTKYPPGHFYSPIPSVAEVLQYEDRIFSIVDKGEIKGINFNEKKQFELLNELKVYYPEIPFSNDKKENLRYYFYNPNYFNSDAIFLYSLIRHYKPKQIIEAGSGFSSALMMDVNDLFFDKKINFTFIEPYPERLFSLIDKEDKETNTIKTRKIQEIPLSFFEQLEENDFLFIDSSHVSKVGSDLNYIIFDILPCLQKGVIIHFHDIFYPFEYPKQWILKGRAWNENYLLRAFLQYNMQFEIILFNTFLQHYYEQWFIQNMPLCIEGRVDGVTGSIWLKKL